MGWARLAIVAALLPVLFAACGQDSGSEPSGLEGIADSGTFTEPDGSLVAAQCYDAVAQAPPKFEIDPCVHSTAAGDNLAVFDWSNRSGVAQVAPYGSTNQISASSEPQGQPEYFEIGTSGRVIVPLAGDTVTWTILGESVSVSSDSPECGDRCLERHLAGPDEYYEDTCATWCGDGECSAGETCASCPSDCDCSALEPLLDCVVVREDGKLTASFGYRNGSDDAAVIVGGPDNGFSPGEAARAQPTYFLPGETHHAFLVTFEGDELTWSLGGLSVTANAAAQPCEGGCSDCPAEFSCVEGECRGSCGDGVCTEGDCASCPTDCACPAMDICLPSGGCFDAPRCGVEAYCGTLDSYGNHLDCGDCPDGETCVLNVCHPICGSDGG